jgi:hypothetical protein
MKWIEEVWGLFVDEPVLALLGIVSLAVAFIISRLGYHDLAGLAMFATIVVAITISLRRD